MSQTITISEIINSILIAGAIYGFIFNSAVFFSRHRKGRAILFLNLLVFFISLNNLQAWMIDSGLSLKGTMLEFFRVPWYFLVTPMFHVFIINYLRLTEKINSFLKLTWGLFIGTLLIRLLIISYFQIADNTILETKNLIDRYSSIEEVGSFIYALFLIRYPITLFFKNKKLLKEVMNFDDLRWVRHFLTIAGVILFIWIISIVQNLNAERYSEPAIYGPLRLATSLLIYWIGIKGLFRYRLMEDRMVLRENIRQELLTAKGPEKLISKIKAQEDKNQLKTEKQKGLFQKIDRFVLDHKRFSDPYLSLDTLAEELQMSVGYLSHLINAFSGYNFSDYINSLRVDQAKSFITNTEFEQYTMVAIGLESGFNSKSTFYAAFKKFAGMSPSQFRSNHLIS